jgi:hypothetical protein
MAFLRELFLERKVRRTKGSVTNHSSREPARHSANVCLLDMALALCQKEHADVGALLAMSERQEESTPAQLATHVAQLTEQLASVLSAQKPCNAEFAPPPIAAPAQQLAAQAQQLAAQLMDQAAAQGQDLAAPGPGYAQQEAGPEGNVVLPVAEQQAAGTVRSQQQQARARLRERLKSIHNRRSKARTQPAEVTADNNGVCFIETLRNADSGEDNDEVRLEKKMKK